MGRPPSIQRYNVYVERLEGWVEAASWGVASTKAIAQFGHLGEVTRVQPQGGADSDDRTDRERGKLEEWKTENNDHEQDGA